MAENVFLVQDFSECFLQGNNCQTPHCEANVQSALQSSE